MGVLQRAKLAANSTARRILNFGMGHYCPVCKSNVRRFHVYDGPPPRLELHPPTACPVCSCHNRHRMIRLWLERKTNLFDGKSKKVLHFAPEERFAKILRKTRYLDYVSADFDYTPAMLQMDITAIQFPDNTFDVILCSHVLEHILDDRKAMAELFRVLKPGGWAWLQVPITAERIYEDPTATSLADRERLFGQADHVRRYGLDYRDRLAGAGFIVASPKVIDEFTADEVRRYGLLSDEDRMIWYCRKP